MPGTKHSTKRDNLADLVETVGPTLAATVATLATKGTPILDKGQKLAEKKRKKAKKAARSAAESARESARSAAETMSAHVPAPVAEKLHLPTPPKKGRWAKRLALLAVVGVTGAVVARKASGGGGQDGWQPAPEAPRRTTSAGPATDAPGVAEATGINTGSAPQEGLSEGDVDAGAAAPGEALSDAAAGPHPDTTPDAPAEVEQLDVAPDSADQGHRIN